MHIRCEMRIRQSYVCTVRLLLNLSIRPKQVYYLQEIAREYAIVYEFSRYVNSASCKQCVVLMCGYHVLFESSILLVLPVQNSCRNTRESGLLSRQIILRRWEKRDSSLVCIPSFCVLKHTRVAVDPLDV